MKVKSLGVVFSVSLMLMACGGGSGSDADDVTDDQADDAAAGAVPVSIAINDLELRAGTPVAITNNLPAVAEGFSEIRIDLARTLESADIQITTTE